MAKSHWLFAQIGSIMVVKHDTDLLSIIITKVVLLKTIIPEYIFFIMSVTTNITESFIWKISYQFSILFKCFLLACNNYAQYWRILKKKNGRTLAQTHHVYSTLKRHGNYRFHVVSTWNTSVVFARLRHWPKVSYAKFW